MQHVTIKAMKDFEVIAGSKRSQAATMVLEPGESTGAPITSTQTVINGCSCSRVRAKPRWPGNQPSSLKERCY